MNNAGIALCAALATYAAFPLRSRVAQSPEIDGKATAALRNFRRRSRTSDFDLVAQDLSLLSASLSTSKPIRTVLKSLNFEVLTPFTTAASNGTSFGDTARELGAKLRLDELDAFGLALDQCEQSGAPIAPVLDLVAKQVAHRSARTRLVNSELASTRATVVVLAALPLMGVVMSTMAGGDSLHWLFATHVGHICLAIGVCLETVGLLWVRMIVRRVSC